MVNLTAAEWLVLLLSLGVFVVAVTTVVALLVWTARRGQRPQTPPVHRSSRALTKQP